MTLLTKQYIPLGTKLLVELPPPKADGILIPEGSRREDEPQHAEILAIGDDVVDDKFKVKVGDTVILVQVPTFLLPTVNGSRTIFIDKRDIVAVVYDSGSSRE